MSERPSEALPPSGLATRTRPGAAPDPGERDALYLRAGEIAVASHPTAITTVLGSCVAVCLYDVATRIGGMNHFLLPHHVERERSPRFGTVAVPELLAQLVKAGARRSGLQAKVFGGSSVLGAQGRRSLGDDNAELALRLLEEARIPVVDQDVGGQRGRKLIFHSDDGTGWIRQL